MAFLAGIFAATAGELATCKKQNAAPLARIPVLSRRCLLICRLRPGRYVPTRRPTRHVAPQVWPGCPVTRRISVLTNL
jgi:hypothetical protein